MLSAKNKPSKIVCGIGRAGVLFIFPLPRQTQISTQNSSGRASCHYIFEGLIFSNSAFSRSQSSVLPASCAIMVKKIQLLKFLFGEFQ
jgi:hypothetical protein